MGILDQIAQGGTSRPMSMYLKGQQEKRAGKLSDLNLQIAEKKLESYDKDTSLETDKLKSEISKNKAMTDKINMEVKKYNTEEDLRIQEQNDSQTLNMMEGALNQYSNDPNGLKSYMESNYDTFLELGSDAADEGLNRMMEMSPDQLMKALPQMIEIAPVTMELRREMYKKKDKAGKAQSLQILEPGETVPRMATFENGKHYIIDDNGVKREAHPASQVFGKSKITGAKGDVITERDRSKELTKFKDYGIAQQKVISAIDTLTKELGANKDGTLLGALGGAATTIESIAQQVRTVQSKLGGKQASSKSSDYDIAGLTGLAIETSRAKSMIIDLAFSIATAREGGKLTDRDIKAALETIGANSGSIPQMVAALGVKRSQITRDYGIEHRSRMGTDTPEGFFPGRKKSLSELTPDELSNLTNEELDAMLKRKQ